MSLDQQIYGSTDWHLPSPSSTPKSATFPDASFTTPRTESALHSHFLDAWSTPRLNGNHTPTQTPSFATSTPVARPSSSHTRKIRSPEDPEFHVNQLVPSNLPLPPVEPSQRLSSSPGPLSTSGAKSHLHQPPSQRPPPISMDPSHMQTPPPTRDASSRRSQQRQTGNEFATPATVIARTPVQLQQPDHTFNQTPFDFPALQFSPDAMPFSNTGPLSAPPLPHSRLFWDRPSDGNDMDVDIPLASDPFGPTPHKIGGPIGWETFHTPATTQMNPQAFQALHGVPSPTSGNLMSTSSAGPTNDSYSRPSSFVSTPAGVDPSMLFSFSSPGPASSFSRPVQRAGQETRLPYETQEKQYMDSLREREQVKRAKSQHSRTSTASSTASFEQTRPVLQRSATDSAFRRSRPSSVEGRPSSSAAGYVIPRRSSPLKRQSGGSLMSIPEIRRSRTRLVIDEDGRARTETVMDDDSTSYRDTRRDSRKDWRHQYPDLCTEDGSDSDNDEAPITLSRNSSFTMPQRRASKHARTDSGGVERANSLKMPRPSSGNFDRSSFETVRPGKRAADNPFRRFSMMDFPSSFGEIQEVGEQQVPDSPGDALGALKKVVEGRQKRIERSTQNTLKAHNQRWAQASAELNSGNSPHSHYDPLNSSFNASPTTTPSTDRSSLSNDSTRCICNSADDGRPMIQCESCNKWLHKTCVGLSARNPPPVYVCIFCTGSTPVARGGRVRGPMPSFDSPLTHKSVFWR
ncbi:uncharacterized protein EI97DRAFT_314940 [Westerdykella ornata]|uniref:PHD-type domain-containing protein n=1 Tax=Westerdykella ornata TaxID=318751 RepID=A0A6A6JMC5_WESOR|nr:uncharacterized protein EI97DRAFT_314940 [Westerdykella ornata]KAF2277273.1 hypothetical protein EI97DRAFT_314940 [Westerdykella ornata]